MAHGKYGIVFTAEPSSVDIFSRYECIDGGQNFVTGSQCTVKMPSWQSPCQGEMLRVGKFLFLFFLFVFHKQLPKYTFFSSGTKASLSRLKVTPEKEVVEAAKVVEGATYLTTRFQALKQAKKMLQSTARQEHLERIEAGLASAGPSKWIFIIQMCGYCHGNESTERPQSKALYYELSSCIFYLYKHLIFILLKYFKKNQFLLNTTKCKKKIPLDCFIALLYVLWLSLSHMQLELCHVPGNLLCVPSVTRTISKSPKKRDKEVLEALRLRLQNLPCFSQRPGDVSQFCIYL